MRFITIINDGQMKINSRKKVDLIKELKDVRGFKTMDEIKAANKYVADDDTGTANGADEEDVAKVGPQKGFEYLLGMNLWSLTHEKVEELRKELAEKSAQLDTLLKKTEPMLWEEDLAALEEVLTKTATADAEDDAKALRLVEKSRRKALEEKSGSKAKSGRAKAKKADSDSDDDKATPMRPVIPPRPVLSPAQQAAGKGLLNESNIGQTDGLLARLLARQEQRNTQRAAEDAVKTTTIGSRGSPTGSVAGDEPMDVDTPQMTLKVPDSPKQKPSSVAKAKATPKSSAKKRGKNDNADDEPSAKKRRS